MERASKSLSNPNAAVCDANAASRHSCTDVLYERADSRTTRPTGGMVRGEKQESEADNFVGILTAWDRLNGAIKDVLTSQPHHLTETAAALREQQRLMDEVLRQVSRGIASAVGARTPSDGSGPNP